MTDRVTDRGRSSLKRRITWGFALAALVLASVPIPVRAALDVALVEDGFANPVYVTNAGDTRLFVVEQDGIIKVINDPDGTPVVTTFLDITALTSKGGELGLLGLAFHPDYATNGLFYVDYTRASDNASIIAEYKVKTSNPDEADPASFRRVLKIKQPYENHKGGWIGFYGQNLYIAKGDGGSGGDPGNRALDKSSLLGKILRINPLNPPGAATYSIPNSNPYVGRDGRDEIWARGLRNPWRCSFDGDDLWCGDVGQEVYEEVDRWDFAGANLGWRKLEGNHYYKWPGHTRGNLCTSNCKTQPIVEYSHSQFGGENCAVTGGYVARRPSQTLTGKYIYADYCSGVVWSIDANAPVGTTGTLIEDTGFRVSSFGLDSQGRIYLVDRGGDAIYRLTGT